jgi:hypothetical protein
MRPLPLLRTSIVALATSYGILAGATQPLALVYKGPAACKGCPEAVAGLLQSSTQNFTVTFVGPNEDVTISADALSKATVYAQPGGPGS